MEYGKRIALVVVAAAAVLLQVLLAPYIAIGSAVPNFIIVAAVLAAVTRGSRFGSVLPFVLGLIFDLVSGGPVGPMAFTLLLAAYSAARLYAALDNDTAFVPVIVGAGALLVIEVVYGGFLLVLGYSGTFADALVYRAVPCFVYDLVVFAVLYPLVARLFVEKEPLQASITRLR